GLTVRGSGFGSGAELSFELDGVASDQITVNAVTVIDESTLIANVDVSAAATETFFDVAVTDGPKKRGVGIDLLKIVPEFVVPILESTPLPETLRDGQFFDAANGLLVGVDLDGCGWVYEVATQTKHCLTVPGVRDPIYPMAINSSGTIVGLGYPVSGGGNAQDEIPFVIDWPSGSTTVLPIDGWQGGAAEAINEAGVIVGSVAQADWVQVRKNLSVFERQGALIRWNLDGTVAGISSTFENVMDAQGVSDGGLVVARAGLDGVVWDGQGGSIPVLIDDGGLGNVQWPPMITGAGELFTSSNFGGNIGSRILHWTSPFGSPAIYSNLDVGLSTRDEVGNVFGRTDSEGVCIAPDGSWTRLTGPEDADRAWAAVASEGVAYGYAVYPDPNADPGSFGTISTLVTWDISGGC
ncbi:MAG: hypothetical protein R3324_03370, partial [Halobacteriales archaeon]|nr:hypothetical protein [Halobacteriales archaeon]